MLIRNGLDRLFILVFDLGDDPLEIDVQPAAGRAGDHFGLRDAAVAGAQDVEAGIDLGHRIAQQRDANRIADAPQENGADARGALERAVLSRAGLGDSHVGGIVALRRVLGVTLHGRRHVAGLQADDHQLVAQRLGRLDVPQGALDHRLGAREAVLVDQVFLETARVDADPHRHACVARLADDLLEPLLAADIARVDPDLVHGPPARGSARFQAGEGHAIVVMDVGDQRDRDPVADVP